MKNKIKKIKSMMEFDRIYLPEDMHKKLNEKPIENNIFGYPLMKRPMKNSQKS